MERQKNDRSTEIPPLGHVLHKSRKKIIMLSDTGESESDFEEGSAFLPMPSQRSHKTHSATATELPRNHSRSILHRAFESVRSFVQQIRTPSKSSVSAAALVNTRRSLNDLPKPTPTEKPRKMRQYPTASGENPVRLGNNLGIERQSCNGNGDELHGHDDGCGDLELDLVKLLPRTARPSTRQNDERKEYIPAPENPESEQSEIKNTGRRPPIPPSASESALGRPKRKHPNRVTFSSTNPQKSQSQFQGTLANPPLDHSTSHGTVQGQDKIQRKRKNDTIYATYIDLDSRLPARENISSVVSNIDFSKNETENVDSRGNFHRQIELPRSCPISPKVMVNKPILPGLRISPEIISDHARVMYIPWDDAKPWPSKSGHSFKILEKKLNEKAIKARHGKSILNLERAAAFRAEKNRFRKDCWQRRSIIGLYKNTLRDVYNLQSLTSTSGNLDLRFHHINWFTSGTTSKSHVGRYFDLDENRLVAIKIYGCALALNEKERLQSKITAMIEISALAEVSCENVVQMIGYYELNSRMHMVMAASDRSLKCEMQKARMCPIMTRDIIRQVVNGLAFCHKKGCLHANISPENILFNAGCVVKLADFKTALFLNRPVKHECPIPETINYSAPEILVRTPDFTLAADIWSVGCLVSELIKGVPLWNYSSVAEQLDHIQDTFEAMIHRRPYLITYPYATRKGTNPLRAMFTRVEEDAFSFVTKCLDLDPTARSTCSGLLNHEYLTGPKEIEVNSGQPSTIYISTPVEVAVTVTDQIEKETKYPTPVSRTARVPSVDNSVGINSVQIQKQCLVDLSLPPPPIVESFPPKALVICCPDPEREVKRGISRLKSRRRTPREPVVEEEQQKNLTTIPQPQIQPQPEPVHTQRLQIEVPGSTTNKFTCHQVPSEPIQAHVQTQGQMERTPELRREKTFTKDNFTDRTNPEQACLDIDPLDTIQRLGLRKIPKPAKTSRIMMKEILHSVGSKNPNNPEIYVMQLKRISKVSPKLFSYELGNLLTVLLDQIAHAKAKIASSAIRILSSLYDFAPKLAEAEADRIIPAMLGKFGCLGFIDHECNEIMQQIVNHSDPRRIVPILVNATQSQRTVPGRIGAGKYLCEAVRKLNFLEDLGDDTITQRRLTNKLLDVAANFTRDASNTNKRELGKDLFYLLLQHPSFWRIYIDYFPSDQRSRLNPHLDEIRRILSDERNRDRNLGREYLSSRE